MTSGLRPGARIIVQYPGHFAHELVATVTGVAMWGPIPVMDLRVDRQSVTIPRQTYEGDATWRPTSRRRRAGIERGASQPAGAVS